MLNPSDLADRIRDAGPAVEVVPGFGSWSYGLRIRIVEGLDCTVLVRDADEGFTEAVCTCSVTADVQARTYAVEDVMAGIDGLVVPARLFLYRDEIGFSIWGGCSDAVDLEALCLEYLLMSRRLCLSVLAPLVAFAEGRGTGEDVASAAAALSDAS